MRVVQREPMARQSYFSLEIWKILGEKEPLVWATKDEKIGKIITKFAKYRKSQIIVFSRKTDGQYHVNNLLGIVKFEDIALRLLFRPEEIAEFEVLSLDEMEDIIRPTPKPIDGRTQFSEVIEVLNENEFLLVQNSNSEIQILTKSRALQYFIKSSTSFLKIGNIERKLRMIIESRIKKDLIEKNLSEKWPNSLRDTESLDFGDYQKILGNKNIFDSLNSKIDRKDFISCIEKVRIIRNNHLHFKVDIFDEKLQKNHLSAIGQLENLLELL